MTFINLAAESLKKTSTIHWKRRKDVIGLEPGKATDTLCPAL